MERRQKISGYKSMWLIVLFDLPVDTKEARRNYRQFRKALLRKGFTQLQLSVYARFFRSEERAEPIKVHVRACIPPDGHVRMFSVTNAQFAKMESYYGQKREPVEKKPKQMRLF